MGSQKFTEANYAEWQRLYLEGLSSHDIAKKYEATASTVRRRLTQMGIEMRPVARPLKTGNYVDDAILAEWRKDYEEGLDTYEIATKAGVASSTVARRFKTAGCRNGSNAPAADVLDPFEMMTPDKAWLLGLLYTDGNIYGNRVRLASNDRDMLEKAQVILAPFGGGSRIIANHVRGSSCEILQISSVELAEHVKKYGIYARKSLTISWPEFLDRVYWSHFLRGVLDGDGYIGLSGGKLLISYATGSVSFAESIATVIGEVIDYKPSLWKHKKWNSYQVGLYSAKAKTFGAWLYHASEDKNRMNRKYNRYIELCVNKKGDA